jgi:16S rRNA (cytosine967-C5)-methyltransferase
MTTQSRQSIPDQMLAQTLEVLKQWEQGAAPLDQIPRGEHQGILTHSLLTLFRQLGFIDYAIDHLGTGRIRPRLRQLLRWGLCQIFYMQGIPVAVAVDTCVRFAKRRYGRHEAGFVNALLRKAATPDGAEFRRELLASAPAHVRLCLSAELYQRWTQRFSPEELEALAQLLLTPAPLLVRRRQPDSGETVPACLMPLPAQMPAPTDNNTAPTERNPATTGQNELDWTIGQEFWLCQNPGEFFVSEEFKAGRFYIQDPSTLLAPYLLQAQPGETIADLCAAPGGKSLLLAEALAGTGRLFSYDRSAKRLERVRENCARWSNVTCAVGDACAPALPPNSLDAVLLDVPCSNSGVIRRRPDVRWRYSARQVRELTELQAAILAGCAPLVRPGGRLVYSTCSIEPEENRQQVEHFLAGHPSFRLQHERQLLPGEFHDGAYAALLLNENS